MATYKITAPDGNSYNVTAPDDASQDDVLSYAQKNYKMAATPRAEQPKKTSFFDDVKQGSGNLAAGALRGAGSIGATLLAPKDMLMDAMEGKGLSLESNRRRREAMDQGLQSMGAEPDSMLYKGGKLAGEVAGTAGAGSAVANSARLGLAMGGKAVPAALDPLLTAISSGGFSTGAKVKAGVLPFLQNQGVRAIGGAVSGGLSAGMVDPETVATGAAYGAALPSAVKVAGEAGKLTGRAISGIAKNTLGLTTGAGAETFKTAYRAGKEGGTSFVDNMRGNVPMTDVLDSAKDALSKMRIDRGNQYRSGMVDIANDKSVIGFAPIEKAVNSLKTMGSYKGQVINENSAGTVEKISSLVDKWKSLDPAEYHTPEGLDALKQAISDIRDTTQFGTAARKAADTAYNAVKTEITSQAPTYAKTMKDYSQASDVLSEIEKALSLGNKAAADTSMRKLQSLMRNNVNTNFGNRLGLAKQLEESGAEILPAIAGQAASSFTPRGLQGLAATGAGLASLTNPMTLAALPFTSPRLMGELSYGLGAANRGIGNAAGKLGGATTQFVSNGSRGLLDAEQLRQLLTTTPVIYASQR